MFISRVKEKNRPEIHSDRYESIFIRNFLPGRAEHEINELLGASCVQFSKIEVMVTGEIRAAGRWTHMTHSPSLLRIPLSMK